MNCKFLSSLERLSVCVWPVNTSVFAFRTAVSIKYGYRHGDGGCSIVKENET